MRRKKDTLKRSHLLMLAGLLLWAWPSASPRASGRGLSDSSIQVAVHTQLIMDPAVYVQRMRVRVRNGVARLSGAVSTLRARRRAAEVALGFRGVRAVVNRVRVRPAFRPDGAIRRDVIEALRADPVTESAELHVSVRGGRVTLAGLVDAYLERKTALEVARGVRGVAAVLDRVGIVLDVRRSSRELAREVRTRLDRDARVDATSVAVSSRAGQVRLDGSVSSAAERAAAVEDAWVRGVRRVDARALVVDPFLQRRTGLRWLPGTEVAAAVRAALRQDPRVPRGGVTATVLFDTVSLHGTVDSLAARRAAERDARNTAGVLRVLNHIVVHAPAVSDGDIERMVRRMLRRDADLSRYRLSAQVNDGQVSLRGSVASYFDRELAARSVSRLRGVRAVDNRITVALRRPFKDDRSLLADIQQRLFWSPFVERDDVKVAVDAGVATLTGRVASWTERRAAARAARAAGARRVENRLALRGGGV